MFQKLWRSIKNFFSRNRSSSSDHENRTGLPISPPDPVVVEDHPAPSHPIHRRFEVVDHKFKGVEYIKDPDMGGPLVPRIIVLHFTCSYNLKNTIDWFARESVDIHLLVDKDGTAAQMVPFNRVAHHAGKSNWQGYFGLNDYAIGIEAINIGPLVKKGGVFYDYYDRVWKGPVIQKKFSGYDYWEPLTEAQVQFLVDACVALCLKYHIKPSHICAHHECSPGRKNDLGGVLPMTMDDFRTIVLNELYSKNLT